MKGIETLKRVSGNERTLEDEMDLKCSDVKLWREALSAYPARVESLSKPDLVSLDAFYRLQLPPLLRSRNPSPHITKSELLQLMKWKLTRGKWR